MEKRQLVPIPCCYRKGKFCSNSETCIYQTDGYCRPAVENKSMQKTFWCVQSRFFNDGKVKAVCYSVEEYEKPANEYRSLPMCDVYCDYFDTYEDANKHLQDCYKA